MRNVTVAVVQMQCAKEVEANIAKADAMVREAAAKGAKIILLPELFERPYFCQERQYEYYAYATPTAQNPAVQHFRAVAKELGVVLPISFYEKAGTQLFNSIAVLDADGTLLGVYRKTHIPDDHYYQEKFYFTPGDTGFKVWPSCCCTPRPLAANPFWIATAPGTGAAACRAMPAATLCRFWRQTASVWKRWSPARPTAGRSLPCGSTAPPSLQMRPVHWWQTAPAIPNRC